MCGLAGILNIAPGRAPVPHTLAAMIAQLTHRGPDGCGYHTDAHVGLAHARLSIIDLAGGGQPIHNEDKTVWVVFNGEIFNYIELRRDLVHMGHRFYTESDTEVLVHLYEEYGDDFVQYLNGQFAIALWDAPKRRLLLVRDRAGILPLFYAQQKHQLLFGSEIKALLPAFGAAPRLSLPALDQVMTFWSCVGEDTAFEGVRQVRPGELVAVEQGRVTNRAYWTWDYPDQGDYRNQPTEVLAEELHDLLVDATRIRLRADVPVGAYLSGGLDSSAVVALIDRYGEVALRTFSLSFSDHALDESQFQRNLVAHINTEHTEIRCSERDVAERFPSAVWMAETPVLRTAPVPMAVLSGAVRAAGYKVVLTGEGADEVLGGYDIFKEAKIRAFWARARGSRIRPLLLKRLYPYLELSRHQGQIYLQNFFGLGLEEPDAMHFSHIPRWVTTAKCKEFFSGDVRAALTGDAVKALIASLPTDMPRWHPFHRAQYLEARTLLPGYLLSSQGDRMLMTNSVEGRFPYLDHRVIEFARQLSPRAKMRVLREKYLLKRAMQCHLPPEILQRHKQPYRAPDVAAFATEMPEYARDMLSAETIRRYGYFDERKVQQLLQKIHRTRTLGAKDNMAFVGILSTQLWHRFFVERYATTFLNPSLVSPLLRNNAVGAAMQ